MGLDGLQAREREGGGGKKKKQSLQISPVLLKKEKKENRKNIWGLLWGLLRFWYPRHAACALLFHAHGQVDEGEDVVLDHDGEAEEDGVQDEDVQAQLRVQPPFIQVDSQHLCTHIHVGISVCRSPVCSKITS